MNDLYLLNNKYAEYLYFEVAKDLPLIDYHNHLNYEDIAAGNLYADMSAAWILLDGYKHRAMRICGVDEEFITGSASRKEKFISWCKTVPMLLGGPLYDWSKKELHDVFGIELDINAENADAIWEQTNAALATDKFSAKGLYDHFNVKYSAPCTEIQAPLAPFDAVESMVPSLRADNLLIPSMATVGFLSENAKLAIRTIDDYIAAISHRLDAFSDKGCCFSDHSLDNGFRYKRDGILAASAFRKLINEETLSEEERLALESEMLVRLSGEYAARGWTLQLHMGSQRTTSTRIKRLPNACGGYAAIGNSIDVNSLVHLLDDMEQSEHGLPRKVIIYTLNPIDNAVNAILSGSFVGVTQGPAWWWCDHLQGMRDMLDHFANYSVLSTFVGMNTDSRSIMSLCRHDYFRRTFCGWIGEKVERGELPYDKDILTEITRRVCYENALRLFEE